MSKLVEVIVLVLLNELVVLIEVVLVVLDVVVLVLVVLVVVVLVLVVLVVVLVLVVLVVVLVLVVLVLVMLVGMNKVVLELDFTEEKGSRLFSFLDSRLSRILTMNTPAIILINEITKTIVNTIAI